MACHRSRLRCARLLALLSLTSACVDEGAPTSSPEQPASSRVEQLPVFPHVAARSSRHEALRFPAQVATDKDGIPHVFARSETDMVFLQGYVHARDRLFQMDVSRRQADGTLAELLGSGEGGTTLASDVMSRTIGLRRAAERSLAVGVARHAGGACRLRGRRQCLCRRQSVAARVRGARDHPLSPLGRRGLGGHHRVHRILLVAFRRHRADDEVSGVSSGRHTSGFRRDGAVRR